MKIAKSLPIACQFAIVLFVFLPEIVLLEIKYNQISGGFLQAYRFETLGESFAYLFSAFVIFALCAVIAFYLFRSLLGLLHFRTPILVVHFTALFGATYGLSVFVRYQIHIYFSDAINLTVVKNLAGDLGMAVTYVLNESVILVIPVIAVVGTYLLLTNILKRYMIQHGTYQKPARATAGQIFGGIAIALILFIVGGGFLFLIKQDPKINYGLRRQIASGLFLSALADLTDFDGDGSSAFSQPPDNAPWDPVIHPGSIDIPNNDIDENGLAGDFKPFSKVARPWLVEAPATAPKHLIVIVMESTRADIISKRIDGELVAPNLATLAESGTFLYEAYSHTGYTSTSLNALFSGSFSLRHHPQSLFRQFSDAGFQVSVISGQDESWGNLDFQLGTREVADFFYDPQEDPDKRVFSSRLPSSIKLSEKTLLDAFRKGVLPTDWQVPQFVYLNFQAGHFPYFHEQITRRFVEMGIPRSKIAPDTRAWLQNTYWNAMNYADSFVGELLAVLSAKGVLEDTLIVVLGDHGESLFDDNFLGHGHYINNNQLRIPLVFSMPGLQIRQPLGLVNLFEVIATLYDLPTQTSIHRNDTSGCVLHFIGKLQNPSLVGHTCADGQRVVYDIGDQLVQFDNQTAWQLLSAVDADPALSQRFEALVRHWENIVWIEHQYQNGAATE